MPWKARPVQLPCLQDALHLSRGTQARGAVGWVFMWPPGGVLGKPGAGPACPPSWEGMGIERQRESRGQDHEAGNESPSRGPQKQPLESWAPSASHHTPSAPEKMHTKESKRSAYGAQGRGLRRRTLLERPCPRPGLWVPGPRTQGRSGSAGKWAPTPEDRAPSSLGHGLKSESGPNRGRCCGSEPGAGHSPPQSSAPPTTCIIRCPLA